MSLYLRAVLDMPIVSDRQACISHASPFLLLLDSCVFPSSPLSSGSNSRVSDAIEKVMGWCFRLPFSLSAGEQLSCVWPALDQD